MAKIKVIEEAREIAWSVTHQGKISVNGKEIDYRLHEDANECELYVLDAGEGWTTTPVDLDTYDVLFDLLLEIKPEDLGKEGDEFEFDLTE